MLKQIICLDAQTEKHCQCNSIVIQSSASLIHCSGQKFNLLMAFYHSWFFVFLDTASNIILLDSSQPRLALFCEMT